MLTTQTAKWSVIFDMPQKSYRSEAQKRADHKYEVKRLETQFRFGGKCSEEEKNRIKRLMLRHGLTEKALIFKAIEVLESQEIK